LGQKQKSIARKILSSGVRPATIIFNTRRAKASVIMMGPPQTQVDLVVNSSEGATLGAGGAARRAWEEAEQLKMRMADPHFDFSKLRDVRRGDGDGLLH
jgi:hypothetical protein